MQNELDLYLEQAGAEERGALGKVLADPELSAAHRQAVSAWKVAAAIAAVRALGELDHDEWVEQRSLFEAKLAGVNEQSLAYIVWLSSRTDERPLSAKLEERRGEYVDLLTILRSVAERKYLEAACLPSLTKHRVLRD